MSTSVTTNFGRCAAMVAAGVMLVAQIAHADPRAEARRHFKTGMTLISEGHVDAGIGELLEAYSIRPHANVLYNIARAYQSIDRLSDAIVFYRRYLAANPPDAATVKTTLDQLEAVLTAKVEPRLPSRPPKEEPAVKVVPVPPVDEGVVRRLNEAVTRLEQLATQVDAHVSEKNQVEIPSEPADDFGLPYEETVVAASRRAQSAIEAPNSITVISGDEIRASGLNSLPDLLRRVPGAEVMTMGVSSANVSMRGFNQRLANKVMVLIDGRPEYQDSLGTIAWSALPIAVEEIERVEVIRGPGSAMYGANAMLGVVNIITRSPGTGASAEMTGFAGNGRFGGGSLVMSGGNQIKYRASVGYQQSDKYTRDYADSRLDVTSAFSEPNTSLRSARANFIAFYAFNRDFSVALSAGLNRLLSEVYPLGLLRNFSLDGLFGYTKVDFTGGPFKLRFFWNKANFVAGPQFEPVGQRSLAMNLDTNVFDGELLFQKQLEIAGIHNLAFGISGRLKQVKWTYLQKPAIDEVHAALFLQDDWRPIDPLSFIVSYRIDRHPLLGSGGTPGYAHSPRISSVVRPAENHAIRASFATAFRQPTFLESYMDIRIPVAGVNGASVHTQGNRELRPERLLSFEVGYRGEAPLWGLAWDVALYWNVVDDLIILSNVMPLQVSTSWDAASGSFLRGRSLFSNDPEVYTARGGEVGATWNALKGLDLRLSAGLQSVVANSNVTACGPCLQAPTFKLNAGFVYRSPINLDLSADVSAISATTWIEREPAPSDPTRVLNVENPLGPYAVVNARIAYRLLDDRLTIAIVGTQLGVDHQEHPFGNSIARRVFAVISVKP